MLTARKLNDVLVAIGTTRYDFAKKIGISPERISRHFPPDRPAVRTSLKMTLAIVAGSEGLITLADFGFEYGEQRCPVCQRAASECSDPMAGLEAIVAWQNALRRKSALSEAR